MKKIILQILLTTVAFNCASKGSFNTNQYIKSNKQTYKVSVLPDSLLKNWNSLDIINDSIPGISLNKAYKEFLNNKSQRIIVAIIDTETDINHIGLKSNVWHNTNEIANNNIDDDNNGYIDDINGWNFLGNTNGENIIDANYEYVRSYRYYHKLFKDIDTSNLSKIQLKGYSNYKKIKEIYLVKRQKTVKRFNSASKIYTKYINAKKALKDFFPNSNYSYEVLKKIDTVGNKLSEHVNFISSFLDYKDTDENFTNNYNRLKANYEKRINADFDERFLLGDDPNNLLDINYGNNKLSNNLDLYSHGTKVASVIKNDLIKIMPLAIAPYGDTHDKDIALAIRYAVDNGAKVINMSFGKNYSLHKNWIFKALKYAEKNNVIIVSSAGNRSTNLDETTTYPNDHNGDGIEVSNNFLMVGGSTKEPNENLYYTYSNYGKKTVDVFAPAVDIYPAIPYNKYEYDSGTSLAAALISKVAALIFSYYPNLTASQVKQIIMDSGVEYTFPVKTPTKEDKNKMTPFNELSKSGKIVNVYNALIMADSISKTNKRKHE